MKKTQNSYNSASYIKYSTESNPCQVYNPEFLHQVTTHPKVPQPVKRVIAVSKIGFDNNARSLQFTAKTQDGIKVDLLTPAMMLEGNG